MGNTFDINKYDRTETGRIDFSKTYSRVPLPDLCDVQKQSFAWFRDEGISEVFEEMFPVYSNKDGRNIVETSNFAELDFVSAEWGKPSKGYFECKMSTLTYSCPLHVTFRLHHPDGSVSEEKIFMGDFPWMTPSGTFIINGSEKCIASQLIRSPGAYLSKEINEQSMTRSEHKDKNNEEHVRLATDNFVFGSNIIPSRGVWLEYLTDNRDLLSVRLNKGKKLSALTLLRALGLVSDSAETVDHVGNEEVTGIVGLLGNDRFLLRALEKNRVNEKRKTAYARRSEAMNEIFRKEHPGDPANEVFVALNLKQSFFDNDRYDLGRAGRFKIREKLTVYNRLPNTTLVEDLVSDEGEVIFEAGHKFTTEEVLKLKAEEFFEKNENYKVRLSLATRIPDEAIDDNVKFPSKDERVVKQIGDAYYVVIDEYNTVNSIKVLNDEGIECTIVGTDSTIDSRHLTTPDIVASLSYMLNLINGIGETDDTDHLGNKRVRCVGELIQDKFHAGLGKMRKNIHDKMSISNLDTVSIASLINPKPLTSAVNAFFSSDSLSQFMDQTNPLAELTNKRRLSALGKGGLTRDRANSAVRDVHPTHYGRICPIETPEGQNIGLISNLACYAQIDEYGFIETPYRPVNNGYIDNDASHVVWLTADDERHHIIAQANVNVDKESGEILDETVSARSNGEYINVSKDRVDLIDASPKQIVSIAAACIPFLENDDGKRALMGSNMQRQALPLLHPEAPFVGTGLEQKIAHDSGESLLAEDSGEVTYVDSSKISLLEDHDRQIHEYALRKFVRSNKRTCINQTPIVSVGQRVERGQILADGPAMDDGELALGQNVVIAFTTWHGYNYEDAILISERCVSEDLFTNIIIEEYSVDRRKTKLGDEEITREIPNIGDDKRARLGSDGVVIKGTEVKEGDILVGKVSPKGETTETNNDHLLKSIFSTKSDDMKDTSLRVPHGGAGIVLDVKKFSRANGDELSSPDVLESIKVYVAQKRKIQVGDKMSGRHGNKGVVSKVLPVEDMPYMPDGRPVDILLSPMGVPSRMNIGQVLEVQLGLACKELGVKVSTPVFDGASNEEIAGMMKEAGLPKDGKTVLYDGQTGERFDARIAVGVMYMIKLDHMVEDKIHARATGPYSLVTQQPLGGKAQNGGQRFGEMEVWALEAYGAAYTLQEMLTIKSDDMIGRNKTYEAILKGKPIPKANMPESSRVLIKELQGLGINVTLYDDKNQQIDVNTISEEAEKETRKTQRDIRTYDVKNDQELEQFQARNRDIYADLDKELAERVEDNENPETGDVITDIDEND